MQVEFIRSHEEAANIRSFYFKPTESFAYTAGQYCELTLKHPSPDKRGIKRWFTLSSSPTEELLSITTKLNDKGSSFKKALVELKPGQTADLNGPFGDFVLPKLVQTPLIFVAGGIGLTPYHSIVSWLHDTSEHRSIQFIYGVRSEDEIIFLPTFHKAGIQPIIVVSRPSPSWGGEQGHLSAELILGLTKPTEESLIYVSGPEPMVETLERDLKKDGIKKDQLVLDFFPNYESY